MPLQYKVQPGDTVSGIAKRFNVTPDKVQGFRSNDPNTIFPDEVLTIQDQQGDVGQAPGGPQAPVNTGPTIVDGSALQPTPQVPTAVESTAGISTAPQPEVPNDQVIEEALQQSAPEAPTTQPINVNQVENPPAPTTSVGGPPTDVNIPEPQPTAGQTFTTPSGAQVDTQGNVVSAPVLDKFGFDSTDLAEQFKTNPFGAVSSLVQQIMQATGVPSLNKNIEDISGQIEELENARDAEIARIQDDPFSSVSSKAQRIQNVNDKYDQRINARVNRLTLLQSTQQDARNQAEFAASQALNLFAPAFQTQLEDILNTEQNKATSVERQTRASSYASLIQSGLADFKDVPDDMQDDVAEALAGGFLDDGTTPVSSQAQSWAKLVRDGQAKLSDVPSDIRSQVANEIQNLPVEQTAAQKRASEQATVAINNIDKALNTIDKVGGGAFGRLYGQVIPGSDARDLAQQIQTVKALIGFDQLQKMREASPTGGALGQVSERELSFLQSVAGSLDVGQSETQLTTNLKDIKNSFERLRAISNPTTTAEEYIEQFPDASDEEVKEIIQRSEANNLETAVNRPQRNNNPLNIKASDFTKGFEGVTGTDPVAATDGGEFLTFASPEDGFKAAKKLITSENYKNLSVDQALKRWSNSGYGSEILPLVLPPSTGRKKISDLSQNELDAIIKAMANREGFYA